MTAFFRTVNTRIYDAEEVLIVPTGYRRYTEDEYQLRPGLYNLVRQAVKLSKIYEALRTDANDGSFALWSEDELIVALHHLGDKVMEIFPTNHS